MGGGATVHRSVGHDVDYDEEREERPKTLQAYEVRLIPS
jgi:hypothetical protein